MVLRAERRRTFHGHLGAFDIVFRDLLQTHGYDGEVKMIVDPLLIVAAAVFVLMLTGLFYSMNEFLESSDDPSVKKASDQKQ